MKKKTTKEVRINNGKAKSPFKSYHIFIVDNVAVILVVAVGVGVWVVIAVAAVNEVGSRRIRFDGQNRRE